MKEYRCVMCQFTYTEDNLPQDLVCQKSDCAGEGLTGFCVEVNSSSDNGTSRDLNVAQQECGLCVLLMDASGSMFYDPAFKDVTLPSQYGEEFCNKAELVSKTAAQAIFELRSMTKKENAYICAIRFDHDQAVMFHDTVENILATHQNAANLAKYFYQELGKMKGATNINAALEMGYNYINQFKKGQLEGMDNYVPIYHAQYIEKLKDYKDIPNVRIMIYTDGEQLAQYGAITNPFAKDEIDLVLGAYVGDKTDKGCQDLKEVMGLCPVHQQKQFTLLDEPNKIASLKGFFRMASGTSGFCQQCLNNDANIILR